MDKRTVQQPKVQQGFRIRRQQQRHLVAAITSYDGKFEGRKK